MTHSLDGKTALVTAAANGIGRASAEALAQLGASVIATDIDGDGVEQMAAGSERITGQRLDVLDAPAVAALMESSPQIHVLVNCAGWVHDGTILDCDETAWDRSFELNAKAMYRLTRAVLPGMLEQKSGSIINIASVVSSLKGAPRRFAYGASKAAIIGMTKAIAADFVSDGIRCNAICPGTVESPSLKERLAATGDFEKAHAAFKARQPMGRLGMPEEIAEMVCYLAGDLSAFTTGQAFAIDGGVVDLMGLDRAASIDDLRARAKRRIPRFAFDLVDGGAESERNMRRNSEAFEEVQLTPRYMVDVSKLDTRATIIGKSFDAPFGMAPIGMLNAFWPNADLILARLCARENIPYVASSAASTTLERLAEAADGNGWFQLYVSSDETVTEGLIARAETAGYDVMIVTADVPAAGKRDRDIRNQLAVPFRITPEVLLELIKNPTWSLTTLRHGKPNIANYADLLQSATSYADVQKTLITPGFTWEHLKKLRDRWKGKLLVKGILHPQDAVQCAEMGCDGIVVSNHGGRQVAFGPPTIEALPAIADALDGRLQIILDSGVRRGADILRAKALGADFVFAGRALAFGAGAGGEAGAERAMEILKLELVRALGQLGVPAFSAVGPSELSTTSRR